MHHARLEPVVAQTLTKEEVLEGSDDEGCRKWEVLPAASPVNHQEYLERHAGAVGVKRLDTIRAQLRRQLRGTTELDASDGQPNLDLARNGGASLDVLHAIAQPRLSGVTREEMLDVCLSACTGTGGSGRSLGG